MKVLKLIGWSKRFAPLLIAMGVAFLFVLVHLVIELGIFEFGLLSKAGYIHQLDLKSLDLKFKSRPEEELPTPKVIVAAIDDKAIKRFGRWPWNRKVVAEFISKTTEGGARVIGLDATFADADRNSAFVTIQSFLEDFESSGVLPRSPQARALRKRLQEAEQLHENAMGALADVEKRTRGVRGPQRQALKEARRAVERTGQQLADTRAAVGVIERSATALHERMLKQVAAISPDEALAAAIAESPQTIMGYIAYYCSEMPQDERAELTAEEAVTRCKELQAMTAEDIPSSLEAVDRSAVSGVYERVWENLGGQEVEIVRPVQGLRMDDMQIRYMIALLAPLPKIAEATTTFGYFNANPDDDGPMRRIRMLHKNGNKMYPALSLAAVAKYLEGEIRPMNSDLFPGTRLSGIEVGDELVVPTDDHGRLLVNYYTRPADFFPTYSVADFIDGTLEPEVYADKIVLFGMTALGLKQDIRVTPFDPATPGVYVHASAIQNMLDQRFLERFYGFALVEAILYLLLGIVLGMALPRLPVWGGLIATVGFGAVLYVVDAFLVFPSGTWIMNVLPTLQVAVTYIGVSIFGYLTEGREKRKIRNAFQFYLTKSVVDEMLKDANKLQLGGERRTCTVLFSDIRGFTTISERLSPEELVGLLNSYLTPMTNLVFKYDGTLDKYMGDAIMAIFGAPVPYKDHATRACYSALEMMEELKALQGGWREQGLPEIDIGIGLNTGPMSVGNMGSEIRFDYTVMGDNVNLGSRLEGINKQYGSNIIVSEYTLEAARNDIHVREMDSVRVKGKREPVHIFELLGKGKPNSNTAQMIETFEQGISLYKQQQWDEAIALFDAVRTKLKANDFASTMYITRCETMRDNPPGEAWDGVYTMTTK